MGAAVVRCVVPPPGLRRVVLFLPGDPALAERRGSLPPAASGFARLLIPATLYINNTRGRWWTKAQEDEHRFPSDLLAVAQLVIDLAGPLGIDVELVDVNQRGADQLFIDRYVGPADVLPVLARQDGRRLVGSESFAPAAVRRFLQGA